LLRLKLARSAKGLVLLSPQNHAKWVMPPVVWRDNILTYQVREEAEMFPRQATATMKRNLAKAREARVLEQAATVSRLRRVGSQITHVRPGTVALFSPLLRSRI